MQQFKYTVRDKKGATKKGIVEAPNIRSASTILHTKGFVVINIEGYKESKSFQFFGGINLGDTANFTRQLATMITSGLPLTDSLSILQKQVEKEKFKDVIGRLADDIQGGGTFQSYRLRCKNIIV